MRAHLPLLLVAALLAGAPATAIAKGVGDAEICGSDGCRAVGGPDAEALFAPGRSAGPPSAPAPFVTVNMRQHEGGSPGVTRTFTYDYLPRLGLTHARGDASGSGWTALFPSARAKLDELVRWFHPLPAAQLAGVAHPSPAADDGGPSWWAIAGAALAALAGLALLARYATSALKARPRASKSAN
jgi:hypothetical protein